MQPHDAGELRRLLVCPGCRGDLGWASDVAHCRDCGASYPVRDGIPVLLPAGHQHDAHDEIEHLHKHAQAGYFGRALAEEFEIERPYGAPAAYGWTLERKFERAVRRLDPLAGRTVADVCAGSGMDAEMLARRGARVLAFDISEGCARRAKARAERHGVPYLAVVADAERLPLRDAAVDIAFVHDGLHHLERPEDGIDEMARVASRAVSINEPADAAATRVAIRLRLALEREDAGNRVARLDAREVTARLQRLGFDAVAERYFAYYRHTPGNFMQLASRGPLIPAYRALSSAADAAIGRWGNKLQVTATRRAGSAAAGAADLASGLLRSA
ncbi:MAG TPA: methyltransferase domain-containing protein [Candidatus Tectomicrobia bacterium]|nr:methyltransferase domain-containing protein [Candidatus Tectomicrobia bacterium]